MTPNTINIVEFYVRIGWKSKLINCLHNELSSNLQWNSIQVKPIAKLIYNIITVSLHYVNSSCKRSSDQHSITLHSSLATFNWTQYQMNVSIFFISEIPRYREHSCYKLLFFKQIALNYQKNSNCSISLERDHHLAS